MDIQKLVRQYMGWVEQTTIVTPCKDGFYKLSVPLFDHLNDGLEIYVREKDGKVDITDDGYTLSNLAMSGVTFPEGSVQREQIKRFVRKNGVELRGDEIWACTTNDKFPIVASGVLQTILAIDALYDFGSAQQSKVESVLS